MFVQEFGTICFTKIFFQSWEFEVYNMYAEKFDMHCQIKLDNLLNRKDVKAIVSTAGHGVVEAMRFYFPKLLLEPFHHCKQYIEYVKVRIVSIFFVINTSLIYKF